MEIAVLGFVCVFALIFFQIPIALALATVGIVGYGAVVGVKPTLGMIATTTQDNTLVYSLTVLPLFILMGNVVAGARISNDLYRAAQVLVGRRRGALALATVVSCGGFGAVTGSSTATAATMGQVAIPSMRECGYADSLSAASVAAGGTLGILIPPSIILVIYGVATQTHIGELFAAGLIPGLVGVVGYMLAVVWTVWRDPSKAPLAPAIARTEMGPLFKGIMPVVFLFALVMGGIYSGLFTATEAAGIGALGALFLAVVRRSLTLRDFWRILAQTVEVTCSLFAIILGAAFFAEFINLSGIHEGLREFIGHSGLPPAAVVAVIILVYIFLGCVLESLSIILLTIPIFFPVIVSLGYDPVWFGILVVVVTEIGLITPPIGVNLFIIRAVFPDIPMRSVISGVMPFIVADLFRVTLIAALPVLSLWLPTLLFR
ncbi:TRAP transporter large permease [Amorphus sp. MBR-141]